MSTNKQLWERRVNAIPRGVASNLQVIAQRAKNAEIWDVEGKRYIDFASGIAVLNVGHGHPQVVSAIQKQSETLIHAAFQVTPYEVYISLAERLNSIVPIKNAKTILFSTGAEAVENAVKIARVSTGRTGVIAFGGAFHGRTLMTLALTAKVNPYKAGFGPFPGEVYHAPFPNEYRGTSVEDSLIAIQNIFACDIEPSRVAAIILEPVQGEGGFNHAPKEFMQALRKVCDEHGILLIADEIQSGFSRTGKMFATEHSGVEPDIMTMAKSLAGGMTLSAVSGKAAIMDAPAPGGLGGTYGGSPVACAAAHAAIDILEDENLSARAVVIGRLIAERVKQSEYAKHGHIGCIRGPGAMVAIELVEDEESQTPAPRLAKSLVAEASKLGLIILACGVHGNVIRFLTPLTISEELLIEGMDILNAAMQNVLRA